MTATVNDQSITITDESLTVSESVGIYECDFTFDASWGTWNKTAVFEGAGSTIEMIVVDNKAQIPWEVLKEAGWIKIGVYGTKGGEVKPTIWSDQIYVAAGTVPGSVEVTPTPSIYAQILDLANDAKDMAEDAQDTADDVASDWASVSATATTLSAGSPATVTFADNTFTFGIPKGAKGDTGATGATGATPNFSIGTVSTLETGQPATATITGTAAAPVLNLDLPKGNKGDNGDVANIADAYSTSATYAVGDYCIYNSQLYRCTTAITTAEAWTAAHWTAVQLGDDTSTLRSALHYWTRLDGVVIVDGYDLTSEAVESGAGSYYVESGIVKPTGISGYNYYKIPCKAGETYKSNYPARWSIFVDDSNAVISYDNQESSSFAATGSAKYMILSYNSTYDFAVGRNEAPTNHDVVYDLPENVKLPVGFSDLTGKLEGYMVDGYVKGNLASDMVLVQDNKYCYASSANVNPTFVSSNSFYVYSLEISNKKYTFKNARFVLPIQANGKTVSASTADATTYDNTSGNAKYLYLTLEKSTSPIDTYIISEGDELVTDDTYPDWTGANKLQAEIDGVINPWPLKKVQSGSFSASGDYIICPVYQEARKGFRLVFDCIVTSGTDFEVGFNTAKNNITAYPHNNFNITDTAVIWPSGTSRPHGLTITGHVQFILEQTIDAKLKTTLIANGNRFSYTSGVGTFGFTTISVPYAVSKGLISDDCSLVYTNTDFDKSIWMIGDSYTSYDQARWSYYANEDGYLENILLDGFSGMDSDSAKLTFPDIVELSRPKIAVWLMGMNDGSDPNDTTPTTKWQNGVNVFLETCQSKGITPVLATIPSVPTINNKGKNYWVRSHSYRYIDFERAVGADVSDTWYDGMLENTTPRVHPTALGAVALYGQILVDLPEIMVTD